jgi:hypothetical protein
MKLVDPNGKEVTSKENKEAGQLEKQLNKKIENLLKPIMNKIKLAGGQVPQEQLMQLSSAAHQMLFNRMVYNLAVKAGVEDISELVSDDDVDELQTSLSNQLQIVDNPEEGQQKKPGQQPNNPTDK